MEAQPQAAYEDLVRRSREIATLSSCSGLLGWDEQTYMPRGGAEHRGEQMALLAGLTHERATDPRFGELLAEAEASDLAHGDTPAAANLREWRRRYDRATKLPRTLVEELARTVTLAQQVWVEARRDRSFLRFQPLLERMFQLKRNEADCLVGGGPRYDALIDEYEPGARSADLTRLFDALVREVVPLVDAIRGSSRQPEAGVLSGSFPVERQRIFGETVAAAIGFDFDRGRLDSTAHPFCSGIGPGDCRITTRYDPTDVADAFFSILHEVGHGLYEQGLDPDAFGTPMGESASLGIHESQSRLWENAIGRSPAFWRRWFPFARQVFHSGLGEVSIDAFVHAVNRVEPSLIRVQADEVTYNLHIAIRFELERDLLSGDLAVAELPGAWSEKYLKALGVTPAHDAEGCLQDIHWAAGLVGYFPTYTLGNVNAAQLYDRAQEDLGDLDAAIERGDCSPLLGWLRDRIHRHGQRYRPDELMERATGAKPDHGPLVNALRTKYGELYGL